MKITKKLTVGLSTVAAVSIIGGVTAATNQTPTSNNAVSDTSSTTTLADPTSANLQTAQSTQPTSDTATVAAPSSTAAAKPAPAKPKKQRTDPTAETMSNTDNAPITVVKYQEIVVDENHSDCLYTYSDGTTYQFPWKTVNPTGGTQTNPDGTTKTVPTTSYNGVCDYSAIGLPKS